MGKIPQYNRGKFQSSYVGGPQLDTSGVQTAEAVGKVTDTAVNIEAKRIQEKNQLEIDKQADNALLDYSVAYQAQAKALEDTYANNPTGYPEAVTNMGRELQETFSKGIADDRVKARFGGAANTLVRQSSASALKWSVQKQEDNAYVAAKEIARKSSLIAGQTSDVGVFQYDMAQAEASIMALKDIDREEARKLMPEMFESHLYHRVSVDPDGTEADLNDPKGPYSGMEYYTDELKRKFLTKIKSQRIQDKKIENDRFNDKLQDAMLQNTNRTLTIAGLDEMNSDPEGGFRPRDYRNLKEVVFNRVEADADDIYKDDVRSQTYIDLVNSTIEGREERSKALSKIIDVFKDGYLTTEDEKVLLGLSTPLKEVKSAIWKKDMGNRLSDIQNTISKLYPDPIKTSAKVAGAYRDFLFKSGATDGTVSTKKINEAYDSIMKGAVLDKVNESGTSSANIPTGGMRMEDAEGNFAWVYPDGTIKEE